MQNLAINFLVNILIFISEYAITLFIMQSLLNVKLTFNCKNISIIILAILIMSTTDFFLHDYFFCSILIQIELIISTAFIFKPKFQDLIFSFFLEVIFVIAYQLIVVAVLNLFPIKPFGSFYQITGNLLSILFIIISSRFIPFHKILRAITSRSILPKFIIFEGFLLMDIIIVFANIDIHNFIESLISFIIAAVIILCVNYVLFLTEYQYKKYENELKAYKEYLPIVDELIMQIRSKQHNFDNQLQTFENMPLIHKDYDSLASAIKTYTNTVYAENRLDPIIKCNMKLVAGFLISKKNQAASQNKQLNVTLADDFIYSALPEYKLITVLGILIDNAVEATPVENTIFLDIASQNNQCYIKIGNPGPMITSDFLHNIFLPGYTTKHAKNTGHGLGLPSLKTVVNNNNGNITLSNEKINNINYIIFEVTV